MDTFIRELRFACRLLLKNPGSSAMAAVTMALGIGLSAATFSILDGAVLRGLPFPESDRLLHLERNQLAHGVSSMEVTHHDFEDWRAQQTSFEDLAGFTSGTVNLSDTGLPERYNGVWISPNFLGLLRARPLMGRGFRPADALPGAEPVILLGHHVWQKRYGGAPDIVGKVIRANSIPTTVIGVMGEGFRFPVFDDVWMPLVSQTAAVKRGEGETLEVIGRLRDGVTLDEAGSEFATIAQRLAEQYPETNEGIGVVIHSYIREFLGDGAIRLLAVMMGAVLLVLLVACFNVTNLLLGRASKRARELAIRSALGSGRARTVAQVLAEALLVAVAGAVLGIGLAYVGVEAFNAAIAPTNPPFWIHIFISGRVLLFVVGATAAAALIAGLVPAIQASRPNLNHVLQDSTRGSTSFRLGWLSRGLVVVQVAFSCALMVGAALMVRSVLAAHSYDLRFAPENVLTARVGLPEAGYPDEDDWAAFYEELERRLAGESEIVSWAFGTVIPTDTEIGSGRTRFERPGETYDTPRDMPLVRYTVISPGYFETYGLTLLAGRDFTLADRRGAPAVALVNEDFARKEWPGESPIGKRVSLWLGEEREAAEPDAGWVEVVGLVPDLRFAEFDNEDDQQGLYVPLAQRPQRFTWIIAKTRTAPLQFSEPLRRAVLDVDPDLPLYFVRTMDQVLDRTMFFPDLFGMLFSIFGLVALVLASVGMYGVMAFGVTQRTQEMGVRMAFGARVRDVVGLILKQGMRQVSLGLAIGLVLAVGMAMALALFLYQVRPVDPVTFTLVPALLVAVSLLACLVPARRASAVDPIVALRYE